MPIGVDWSILAPLVLFAVVVVVTPGANNILAASSGARFGVRASIPLVIGLGLGVVVLVMVAAAGLGVVITSKPGLRLGLRSAGTAYLLWLAWQTARAPSPSTSDSASPLQGFWTGFFVSVLNPKVWLLGVSAVSGYSSASSNPAVLSLVFGAVFVCVVFPNLLLWCRVGRFLTTRFREGRQWATINAVLAVMLVVSAVPMWIE